MNNWDNIPLDDLRREFLRQSPKDVDGVFNESSLFYREKLLRKLSSLFELTGAPESWDIDYFWTTLLCHGYIGITDTELGILPLECGYSGINVFRHPTTLIFTNPVLKDFQRTIDVDGVLMKLQFNYLGVLPLVQRYATLLAMCDSSLSVGLMNSKVSFVAMAANKQQANSMKKMYDRISSGEPAVFVNNDIGNPANFYFNRVKENFIGQELLIVKRGIMNEFLTEIGIKNANTDKRERLVTDEVNANNEEIKINIADWLYNLEEGVDKANKMFGLSLRIRRREYGEVMEDESSESDKLSEAV